MLIKASFQKMGVLILICLLPLFLAGCTHSNKTIDNMKTIDANMRIEKIIGKKVNTTKEGKWEVEEEKVLPLYSIYISPYFIKNDREMYVILEYVTIDNQTIQFIGYKFFLRGENYLDNYRIDSTNN